MAGRKYSNAGRGTIPESRVRAASKRRGTPADLLRPQMQEEFNMTDPAERKRHGLKPLSKSKKSK